MHKEKSEELNSCEGMVLRKWLCVRGENCESRQQSKPQHILETEASWMKPLEPLVCFHSEQ